MPKFSGKSIAALRTAHPKLQELFNEVVKYFDCAILEGFRDKDKQDLLFHKGQSKLKWPESQHNQKPSMAVDAAPYPINWDDTITFYYFAGLVKGIASQKGIKIRWGGDWDGDNDLHDQTFFDLVHFEIMEYEDLHYQDLDLSEEDIEMSLLD